MKETDIEKFNINTYIDLDAAADKFGIPPHELNKSFYFETLKDLKEDDTL